MYTLSRPHTISSINYTWLRSIHNNDFVGVCRIDCSQFSFFVFCATDTFFGFNIRIFFCTSPPKIAELLALRLRDLKNQILTLRRCCVYLWIDVRHTRCKDKVRHTRENWISLTCIRGRGGGRLTPDSFFWLDRDRSGDRSDDGYTKKGKSVGHAHMQQNTLHTHDSNDDDDDDSARPNTSTSYCWLTVPGVASAAWKQQPRPKYIIGVSGCVCVPVLLLWCCVRVWE